jgi:hypothetical protein
MDFSLILYILFSLVIGVAGTVQLIQGDRTLAGFLFFVGAILVLTFYGLRWFTANTLNTSRYDSKSWPPVMNTCPDFLTLAERTVSGRKERVCVNTLGVSESGALPRFIDTTDINNNANVFRLFDTLTGNARIQALCQECKDKKVTWEGIFDGVACVASGSAPNASGGSDSTSGPC